MPLYSVVLEDEIIDGLELDIALKIAEKKVKAAYPDAKAIPLNPNIREYFTSYGGNTWHLIATVRPTKRARIKK